MGEWLRKLMGWLRRDELTRELDEEMRTHIADSTAAPIAPTAPIEGMIDRMVLNDRTDAEEEIPG